MPAGVSWPRYLTFFAASLASGLAGSQVVHLFYKPNLVRLSHFLSLGHPNKVFCSVPITLYLVKVGQSVGKKEKKNETVKGSKENKEFS